MQSGNNKITTEKYLYTRAIIRVIEGKHLSSHFILLTRDFSIYQESETARVSHRAGPCTNIWWKGTHDVCPQWEAHITYSMESCQKGPTRHAYAWQIGLFWQETIDINLFFPEWGLPRQAYRHEGGGNGTLEDISSYPCEHTNQVQRPLGNKIRTTHNSI